MEIAELEKVLSELLEEYNFLDRIIVLSYEFNKDLKNVFGIFSENNLKYNFSLDYNESLDVENFSWILLK
jgi:hypothetical protein